MLKYFMLQLAILTLKLLNSILKRVLGYSLFSGSLADREKSLKNFQHCAHRLRIITKAKLQEIGPADQSCYLLTHCAYENPVTSILQNEDVMLISIDKHGATFGVFPGLGPVDLFHSRHAPFVYTTQYKKCTELIIVPLHFISELAHCVKKIEPKVVLFSSMGRCGSTLLSQMFEAIPGTVTMSEPSFMSGLMDPGWKTPAKTRQDLLAAGFKLQCKDFNRPEIKTVVIKTASMMVNLTSDVSRSCPEVKHIFMYRNLEKNIISFIALVQGMPKFLLRFTSSRFLGFFETLMPHSDPEGQGRIRAALNNIAESKAGMGSHTLMTLFAGAHLLCFLSARDKDHVDFATIKYEDLLSNPSKEFSRICQHCGITQIPMEACLEAMKKDSQEGSFLSRKNLNKHKKSKFTDEEKRDVNQILLSLGLSKLDEFHLI